MELRDTVAHGQPPPPTLQLRIISDILDYQKIEASLMTLEEDEFSLFEMMKKVFMMARVGVCLPRLHMLTLSRRADGDDP